MRIRMSRNARVDYLVTRIQKIVRKRLAWLKVFRLRKERGDFDSKPKGNRKKANDKGNVQEKVTNGCALCFVKIFIHLGLLMYIF